ncbi:MAG TPA: hypothetical protein VMH37_07150 [Candidatus Binataceae bacterium]|nr:hypothetical protein [Candidatus Binataceae bacterium]
MRIKAALIALSMVVALASSSFAQQGSVDVGYEDEAGHKRWAKNEPAHNVIDGRSCPPAKFDESASCGSIIVSNHSSEIVTIEFKSSRDGFDVGISGGFRAGSMPGQPPPAQPCSEQLAPAERCFEQINFWPRTGEDQHATIRVVTKSPSGYTTTFVKLAGTSHYPPDLQAAEEVRQRHAAELKKIPNVASVELDNSDGIRINVTVKDEEDIPEVRKQVPPKIEGYDTEVTEYMEHAYGL